MAALGWTEADIAKLETRAIVAEHENERLREALKQIDRTLRFGNELVHIARIIEQALGQTE